MSRVMPNRTRLCVSRVFTNTADKLWYTLILAHLRRRVGCAPAMIKRQMRSESEVTRFVRGASALLVAAVWLCFAHAAEGADGERAAIQFFETSVRPVL